MTLALLRGLQLVWAKDPCVPDSCDFALTPDAVTCLGTSRDAGSRRRQWLSWLLSDGVVISPAHSRPWLRACIPCSRPAARLAASLLPSALTLGPTFLSSADALETLSPHPGALFMKSQVQPFSECSVSCQKGMD